MLMGDLLQRLRDRLRRSIRNGQLTERGLARKTGLSQAHVHNVLKGVRGMTPRMADQILTSLGLTVMDLLEQDVYPGRDQPAPEPRGSAPRGSELQDRATSR